MVDAVIAVALGALAGAAIGAAFFAGLWLTVKGVAEQGRPRSLLLISFAVRALLAVGVLALLARQGVLPLLGAVGGFLASRVLVSRLVTSGDERTPPHGQVAPSVDAGGRHDTDATARDGSPR
ncbi:MAG TPA: ATP synthase subunit I [Trueperaceae bacterium]|nr:ATP synthase subunit I [Trueperaceae bacterium]